MYTLRDLEEKQSALADNYAKIVFTTIVFCFQFALVFGDVGHEAILLLLGIFFSYKYKQGITSKLGVS